MAKKGILETVKFAIPESISTQDYRNTLNFPLGTLIKQNVLKITTQR